MIGKRFLLNRLRLPISFADTLGQPYESGKCYAYSSAEDASRFHANWGKPLEVSISYFEPPWSSPFYIFSESWDNLRYIDEVLLREMDDELHGPIRP